MTTCPLCEKTVGRLHKRSHILPEWMYKYCYNEKHKLLNMELKKERVSKRQKGIYKEIICEECEKASQEYDRYASLALTQRSPKTPERRGVIKRDSQFRDSSGDITYYSCWEGVDFHKLQRFVFACVLRTHLAQKAKNEHLLIDKHFRRIHEIYRNESIVDDLSYPIVVTKLEGDDSDGLVFLPFMNKSKGHHFIEFVGAGYTFRVFVSSHKKPDEVITMRLKENGGLLVISIPWGEYGTFKSFGSTFSALARKLRWKSLP